jgi:hypothetical protein
MWGISLPVEAIMRFVYAVRQPGSSYSGPNTTIIQGLEEEGIIYQPDIDKEQKLEVSAEELDNDGTPPIVDNQPLDYDVLLSDFAVACLEENTNIPVGSMRVRASTYRNLHPVLGFFSNYEDYKTRMSGDEIHTALKKLGVESEKPRWWCVDYRWTKKMKAP